MDFNSPNQVSKSQNATPNKHSGKSKKLRPWERDDDAPEYKRKTIRETKEEVKLRKELRETNNYIRLKNLASIELGKE